MTECDPRLGQHELPQHPFERGTPACERDQLLVTRTRRTVGERLGQVRGEFDLGRAGREERVEDVGGTVAQQVAQAGEECVRMPYLRRAGALPLERGVGVRRHRRIVTLEHRHLVAVARARERGAEPRDPAAHNDDPQPSLPRACT